MKRIQLLRIAIIIFAVSSLIISLSIGYYFIIFLPSNENIRYKIELEKLYLEKDRNINQNKIAENKNVSIDNKKEAVQECQSKYPAPDTTKISLFKSEAFKLGYSISDVDNFIQSKEKDRERAFNDCLKSKGYL